MEGKGKSSNKNKTLKLLKAGAGIGMSVFLLISTVITLTFLTVVPVTAAQEQVEVKVSAPEEIGEGGTFDVTIDISEVTDFDSAQFDLSFDSSVVNATNVTDGRLEGKTIPIFMWTSVDADTIRVMVNAPGAEGVNGSGYLAKIGFEVKGKGGDESVLDIGNGLLGDKDAMEIPAEWIKGELKVREEEDEEEEEEVVEEVIPGSPGITAWKPADAIVNNAVGESRAFNVSVNQIADISWQINGTEVQTNESTREAIFTNTSAVIGTWNVSVIATNTTTGLSDLHTWIWSVTLTAITPTPTLAPGVTPTPTLAPGETPKPATPTPTLAPGETPKPATPTPTPTPKPAIPGFEAIFAIVGMTLFLFRKKKTKPLQGLRGRGAEPHSAKRKRGVPYEASNFFKV